MHLPRRQGGHTLLELTAVITIVGALSAVAMPHYVDLMRSARVAKMATAQRAVRQAAQLYHMKWMLAGAPAATAMLDGVEMNAAGYPTSTGILVAAGLEEHYASPAPGVIAADAQHPACRLVYAAESGTSVGDYADGAGC